MKIFKKIFVDAPNSAMRKLAEHFVIRWLRDSGEGKHGEAAKKFYWILAGRKTFLGISIGLMGFIITQFPELSNVGFWIEILGGVLFSAGLADKAIRQNGRPVWAANSAIYKILADNAGFLMTACLSAFAYLAGPDCAAFTIRTLSFSCGLQANTLLVASAVLVYIGVFDEGFLTKVPRKSK